MAQAANGHGVSKINYVSFTTDGGITTKIGHLNFETDEITALAYKSGRALSNLYEVIEVGESNVALSEEVIPVSSVKLLAPISGRDVLAVGKNYAEHAKEFNASGYSHRDHYKMPERHEANATCRYDASDKVDQPTHPVIFTKRATSIIAHGEDIFPHKGFTESVDYEGEIGVIVGKSGFRIPESQAMDYVWGYTIINDMTARERQRDHKQFYLGKSPDTFCPIGPVAVAKEHLPSVLEIQTYVNSEKRQEANTEQLIFSIPYLIQTLSAAQTLRAGDVVATGTPAGVGFGFRPMKFLNPGDEISISVTGLGTLTNKVASHSSENATVARVHAESHIPRDNLRAPLSTLTKVGEKHLFYHRLEALDKSDENIAFIHGLGGSGYYFSGLLGLQDQANLHLMDLEGHGLSPTLASSTLSIASFAQDAADVMKAAGVTQATVIAHSLGCLVAVKLALEQPQLVKRLILMGPPPSPLSDAGIAGTRARAKLVRENGLLEVSNTLAQTAVSEKTKVSNPVAVAALRVSVLGQDPEGYAKACSALASAPMMDFSLVKCPTLIVTGSEDKVSPPGVCETYAAKIDGCKLEILDNVGHWHLFEDGERVCDAVTNFLR